ncbi:MAG: glutamate-1-semialdehyde 2,1-aminomutase [Calditrichaeota bacterium]|nr:glutamate-1-semialdehyde 2,1-aminomutase [Calditrichota bacterium]
MNQKNSDILFERAQKVIPGGVNSPVRAFGSVGGTPLFMEKGEGAYLYDADGNRYLDFVSSWGPLILGHRHPVVLEAVKKAADRGTSFGTPTKAEVELAEKVVQMVPSVEKVRMVNSGTEATMTAVRLARGFTGRDKILKFEGCYHGHSDSFLMKAGSGVATLGIPGSPGVPKSLAADTLLAPYNDWKAVEKWAQTHGDELAAIIVEPVAGNMGTILPDADFLSRLRAITRKTKSLLIFDEVITGFRLSEGGAQKVYGIEPDLTCFGKIIGGGLPVGAVGGRCEVMDALAPAGPVYQAGTLSGNPLAMAAGWATLDFLQKNDLWFQLNEKANGFTDRLKRWIQTKELPLCINQIGSMFTIFFTKGPVGNFSEASETDTQKYSQFFNALLEKGVYFPPSAYETVFLSTAMTQADLEFAFEAITQSLEEIY